MIRYLTSGETHGKELNVIIDGLPAGLKITEKEINVELSRRQKAFGRGERAMRIETDSAEILSGVRFGETIGSPLALKILNADWENWTKLMDCAERVIDQNDIQTRPRPGHADLTGALKYQRNDIRDILERASARETAARVACGAVLKKLLAVFGVKVFGFVTNIGGINAKIGTNFESVFALSEKSSVRVADVSAERKIIEAIKKAGSKGDTLGGRFSIVASGLPVGLGSHTQWDSRLDAKIAGALMSIQAIKGVEFGSGFSLSDVPGSKAHDEIFYSKSRGFFRKTNRAGGIEGGMSNGEDILVTACMKPIPSLKRPLKSVDIKTKKTVLAEAVRSDICAVPSAAVVGEAMVAIELAGALKEKFGGDSILEMKKNFENYTKIVRSF